MNKLFVIGYFLGKVLYVVCTALLCFYELKLNIILSIVICIGVLLSAIFNPYPAFMQLLLCVIIFICTFFNDISYFTISLSGILGAISFTEIRIIFKKEGR